MIHDSLLAHLCCCSQKALQHVGKLAKETAAKLKTASDHAQNDSASVRIK
jgi:hypothetical protein